MHRQRPFPVFVAAMLLVLLPTALVAATTPAFGPKQFNRTSGGPNVYTETFQHCGTSHCQIVIVNGNANGSNRVSSATISLNGVQIAGANEFNPKVDRIVKSVTLADTNQLTVRLTSSPGSFVTINVECEASPASLAIGPAGVDITNPNLLLSAFPIINNGTAAAQNVTTSSITLTGGALSVPASPFNLGTIPAGGSSVLDADFSGAFGPVMNYLLNLKGTYNVGTTVF